MTSLVRGNRRLIIRNRQRECQRIVDRCISHRVVNELDVHGLGLRISPLHTKSTEGGSKNGPCVLGFMLRRVPLHAPHNFAVNNFIPTTILKIRYGFKNNKIKKPL
jgi:hypothetical protein